MDAQKITASNLLKLGVSLSPQRPLMIRGKHGIGKSEIVYQIATKRYSDVFKSLELCSDFTKRTKGEASVQKTIKKFWGLNKENKKYSAWPKEIWHYDMGLPVIERRLSQLSDGDLVGVPSISSRGTTIFNISDWLVIPMEYPCVLFLDELNRASKQNEQATFQLADSRAFYGRTLHEQTWLAVAVNTGINYDVSPMDPAAISRYAVVDYEPEVKEWISYASKIVNKGMLSFIMFNETSLDTPNNIKPESKTQDRRAFINLDAELTRLELYDKPEDELFLLIAGSMLGPACAVQLRQFILENVLKYTVEEVLSDWAAFEKRLSKNLELRGIQIIDLVGRLGEWLPNNPLNENQVDQFCELFKNVPVESTQALLSYVSILAHKNHNNKKAMKNLGSYLKDLYKSS